MKAAFGLAAFMTFVFFASLSGAAQYCTSTYQCNEGYCIDSACTVPQITGHTTIGPCQKTGDCADGFCYKQQCVVPKGENLVYPYEAKSGCIGFYKILPASFASFFCQNIWLITIAASVLAAFLSRGLPIKFALTLAFLFPILIGIFIDPVVGFFICIIEIAYAASAKKETVPEHKKKKKKEEIESEGEENTWDDEE